MLVVSHIVPRCADNCSNVIAFNYPEDIALFEREYVAAQQAAYEVTADEDKEICQRMHDGHPSLFAQNVDERGPHQLPMETGFGHFLHWLRVQLKPHL